MRSGGSLRQRLAVLQNANDDRVSLDPVIAYECRLADAQLFIDAQCAAATAELRRRAATLPLRLHLSLEALDIDIDAALAGYLLRKLQREAERVI